QGLGGQVPVALCFERSIEMVIALLGVLKAGSPYLPLDPELPQERLDFMVADSGARFVLSHGAHASRFANSIKLDDAAIHTSISSCQGRLKHAAKADDLFNIIYTSGSTGKPKGVM